ncbi:MAG TPA: hypothetical protein EYN88_05560 [Candidatus Poseidoniales archaeon]|nr:hypothetical protein [Candidatus Poseidoniales archaeon]
MSPGNAAAGYHGFTLFAGSAYGNISFSTTLVVNITAIHDLQFSDLTANATWLPGIEGNLSAEITNVGSVTAAHYYSILATDGPCSFNIDDGNGSQLAPNGSEVLTITAIPVTTSHLNETCGVQIQARNVDHPSAIHHQWLNLTISVYWALDIATPSGNISLIPGESTSQQLAVWNLGTEDDTAWFEATSPVGINVTVPNGWTSISRGQSSLIEISYHVDTDTELVGLQNITIIANSQNSPNTMAQLLLNITVEERDEISVEGPSDNRIVVGIIDTSTTDFTVENIGTSALEIMVSSSGLPAGTALNVSTENRTITAGEVKILSIEVTTDSTTLSGNYAVSIVFQGGGSSVSYPLTLQVLPRIAISVTSSANWAVVGAAEPAVVSIEVANLGDLQDTISLQIDDSNLSSAFGVALESQTFTLDGGELATVNMTITKIDFTNQESPLSIIATSSLDNTVTDKMTITIFPHSASLNLTAITISDTVAVGSSLEGTLYVTNKGNSGDTFLLSSYGLDCNFSAYSVSLAAGQTDAGVTYSCPITSIILSGPHAFELLATSQADTGKSASVQVTYNVPSTRVDDAVSITLQLDTLAMNYDGGSSITVTVTNLVNDMISGSLSVGGTNVDLVSATWSSQSGLNDSLYSLSPGQSAGFVLKMTSLSEQGGKVDLLITSVSDVDGQIIVDESSILMIDIEGKHMPPDGLILPFGFEVANDTGLNIMAAGWAIALLFLLYLRYGRKQVSDYNDDAMDSTDEVEGDSFDDPNETMMLDGRKVVCPACSTRCTVPRGSLPPFKFTCPSCEEKIRVTG